MGMFLLEHIKQKAANLRNRFFRRDMTKTKKQYYLKLYDKKGQTAMELAVFGSIFIFVLGLIVRTALAYGYQQGQSLKAMRMAMRMSYMYSSGRMGGAGDNNASRNSASVVIIEDRLNSSADKYGAVDRVPYMMSGSAVHSRNLFLDIDDGEDHSLSVSDYWINGIHFPFAAAKFRTVAGFDASHPLWDPACATNTSTGLPVGCVVVYEKIPNHPGVSAWDPSCEICFDLDRDGTPDVPDNPINVRPFFSWQWKRRHAFIEGTNPVIILNSPNEGILADQRFSSDVDGDGKEETVYSAVAGATGAVTSMRVVDFQAGDVDTTWQDGDLDADGDPIPRPGLQRDTEVFTFLRGTRPGQEGTYARIEEGKLYAATPDRQFIRTARKKDQVDIIQREIQLSNFDEGRFCFRGNLANPPAVVENDAVPNPVERCVLRRNECFGANIPFTCLAIDDNYLFVRSRIADRRGHKWVTDTTDDDYVEFVR